MFYRGWAVGEWKQNIGVKLDAATLARIDELVESFYPFCEGRSALIRVLVEVALTSIDSGTIKFDLKAIQDLLSKPRKQILKVVK